MKINRCVIGCVVATVFSGTSLHAQSVDLKARLDEIRQLLKPGDSDSPETKQLKESLQRVPDQWQLLIDQGQFNRISEYGMQGMSSSWAKIPGLSEKIQQLGKSVAEESARRDAAKIAEAEALIAKVAETLKNAKKAEDLDALLLSLSKNQISEYGSNPQLQSVSRNLQGAMQIVDNWQEYLIAEETGNSQTRRNQLEQISSQLARTPILPRSMVLRLLNQPVSKTPETIVTKTDPTRVSLDAIQERLTESGDIAAALAEIKAIPESSSVRSTDKTFEQSVMTVEALRILEPSMSESEVFANIRNLSNSISQRRFAFNRAVDQIALNAIARSYAIKTPSAKTTSARNVLESIATDATANKDWNKLRKAIISLDSLGSVSNYTDSSKRANDLKILSLLELAATAERRNDLEAAANAYIEASLMDGHYLQREVAYSKLADLKEKSPEKIGDVMAKAAELRERAEVNRNSLMLDARERMMERRMPNERLQREDMATLRPVIEQVVAEFLKVKRLEAPNAPENGKVAEETKEPKK